MHAPGMKITNFHYGDITFQQPGAFVEYPKWIHMSGYPSEIAQDAEQEAALLSRPTKSGDVTVQLESAKADAFVAPMGEAQDPERQALVELANAKNIKVDGRWSVKRLKLVLQEFLGADNGGA
jgi:hypothetical protein